MSKLIFKKGERFEKEDLIEEKNKKGLEKLAEKEFSSLSDFNNKLRKFEAYIGTSLTSIQDCLGQPYITKLPIILKKLPVFYNGPPLCNCLYIGNLELKD